MGLADQKRAILRAIYSITGGNTGIDSRIDAEEALTKSGLSIDKRRLMTVVQALDEDGMISAKILRSYDNGTGVAAVFLTPSGVEAVEDAEENPIDGGVPAADRYVRRTDNLPVIAEIGSAFDRALADLHGVNYQDDREMAAAAEFEAARLLIEKPMFSVDLAERCLRSVQRYLTIETVKTIVGKVLEVAITRIFELWPTMLGLG